MQALELFNRLLAFLRSLRGGKAEALAKLPIEAIEFGAAMRNLKREVGAAPDEAKTTSLFLAAESAANEWDDVEKTARQATGQPELPW